MEKRQYTAEYKAKIVLEILAEETSISEIAARESISRTQLQNWKKEFVLFLQIGHNIHCSYSI